MQVPSTIASCRELRVVNVSGNELSLLPTGLCHLVLLEELYAANNNLLALQV
jgi:Leucine-rich repeat (LRR) protein